MPIPYAQSIETKSKIPIGHVNIGYDERVFFSFSALEKNDYFNLDGTCQNWAAELFEALQKTSDIKLKDIYAGRYSGKTSPFRIHQHKDVKSPCAYPQNANLEDMWQIRISKSKGGIHGIFVENVFFVIWFDPHHNLYPDENHGGLKKIVPPSTCCKDRDAELHSLTEQNEKLENELHAAELLLDEYSAKNSLVKTS